MSNQYRQGYFNFISREIPVQDYSFPDPAGWDDGFVAYSAREERLGDFLKNNAVLSCGHVSQKDGYIMEVNFWREKNSVLEEVCIERLDGSVLEQRWTLEIEPAPEKANCFFRDVETMVRNGTESGIFSGAMDCVEVIQPDIRMHVFMSRRTEHG
ncbi:hypothetical protein [Desulfonatronovibrio hydrogenovorans]|uniref:hypothetical protein n=1 Tax=Desulfonatronovibrio hydrogenovorans TaxID=53245 RepID=UPI00048BB566|nr:hypothetical protein [Desulfonatronovibrio hydrogenovorans]